MNWPDLTHNALRIAAGFMFFPHGVQKYFLGDPVSFFSQRGIGGVIEIVGGLLILVGFQTRWAAFICSGMMAVAFWQFHAFNPRHWEQHGAGALLPLFNGGELAAMYCFVFLFLWAHGPGSFSVDAKLGKGKSGR